jgi:hypothetical protein
VQNFLNFLKTAIPNGVAHSGIHWSTQGIPKIFVAAFGMA